MPRTVADIMTTQVITLREEDNLLALQPDMELFGLRHLPVVDEGRLVGLVSHRDVLGLAVSALTRDSLHRAVDHDKHAGTFVASIMQRDVQTAAPDMPLQDAARLLVERKIGCLPVVDPQQRLVGIVTEHDLLRVLVDGGATEL